MQALRRALIATAVLCALNGSWTLAAAQDRMTLLLRTGERITGELDGMVGDRVYIRVGRDEQPKVPIDRIALIDVGGDASNPPDSEVREARGSTHLLVTRGGEVLKGRFQTIEGSMGNDPPTRPVVIFRQDNNTERRFPVGDVRRLYLGDFPGGDSSGTGGTSGNVGSGERLISVPGNTQWVDTGITVRRGDRVTFESSGEVKLGNENASAAGVGRRSPNAPVPDAQIGALIARIGGAGGFGRLDRNERDRDRDRDRGRNDDGQAFEIGDRRDVTMPYSGRLFLGVNDDYVGDNGGQFQVKIKAESSASNDDGFSRRRRRP